MAQTYHLGPARKALNVAVSGLLKVGIGAASSYLLTTTGRRSGLPRTNPVVLVEEGSQRWLVSPYGDVAWVHNVRAFPHIVLRRGRSTVNAQVEEVQAAVAGPVLKRYLSHNGVTAPFFDTKADGAAADFVAEAGHHPVFRIVADAPASAGGAS